LVGRGVLTAPRLGGLRTARPTLRFMESIWPLLRMHWGHEPSWTSYSQAYLYRTLRISIKSVPALLVRHRLEAAGGQSAGNELAQQRNLALLQQRDGPGRFRRHARLGGIP